MEKNGSINGIVPFEKCDKCFMECIQNTTGHCPYGVNVLNEMRKETLLMRRDIYLHLLQRVKRELAEIEDELLKLE